MVGDMYLRTMDDCLEGLHGASVCASVTEKNKNVCGCGGLQNTCLCAIRHNIRGVHLRSVVHHPHATGFRAIVRGVWASTH